MTNQFTTIAALPGSGAGCASSLKREVGEAMPKPACITLSPLNVIGTEATALSARQRAAEIVAKQMAESARRTLLRIAGATA